MCYVIEWLIFTSANEFKMFKQHFTRISSHQIHPKSITQSQFQSLLPVFVGKA
jgi:hypothetical protein